MYDDSWPQPVILQIQTGDLYEINTLKDAVWFLSKICKVDKSTKYAQARRAILAAFAGQRSMEHARLAFAEAVGEFGVEMIAELDNRWPKAEGSEKILRFLHS